MPFDFFDLPRELRNMIYAEALIVPHGDIQPSLWGSHIHNQLAPALLRTSKATLAEAAPLFYGKNRFDLTLLRLESFDPACEPQVLMMSFMELIRSMNAAALRMIVIDFPTYVTPSESAEDVDAESEDFWCFAHNIGLCKMLVMAWQNLEDVTLVYDEYGVELWQFDLEYEVFEEMAALLRECGRLRSVTCKWQSYGWERRSSQQHGLAVMKEMGWNVVLDERRPSDMWGLGTFGTGWNDEDDIPHALEWDYNDVLENLTQVQDMQSGHDQTVPEEEPLVPS